jgi:uncharacterized membrane protein
VVVVEALELLLDTVLVVPVAVGLAIQHPEEMEQQILEAVAALIVVLAALALSSLKYLTT